MAKQKRYVIDWEFKTEGDFAATMTDDRTSLEVDLLRALPAYKVLNDYTTSDENMEMRIIRLKQQESASEWEVKMSIGEKRIDGEIRSLDETTSGKLVMLGDCGAESLKLALWLESFGADFTLYDTRSHRGHIEAIARGVIARGVVNETMPVLFLNGERVQGASAAELMYNAGY